MMRYEVESAFRLLGGAAEVHGVHVDGATQVVVTSAATDRTTKTADPTGPNEAANIASNCGQEAPTSSPSRSGEKRMRPRRSAKP